MILRLYAESTTSQMPSTSRISSTVRPCTAMALRASPPSRAGSVLSWLITRSPRGSPSGPSPRGRNWTPWWWLPIWSAWSAAVALASARQSGPVVWTGPPQGASTSARKPVGTATVSASLAATAVNSARLRRAAAPAGAGRGACGRGRGGGGERGCRRGAQGQQSGGGQCATGDHTPSGGAGRRVGGGGLRVVAHQNLPWFSAVWSALVVVAPQAPSIVSLVPVISIR